MTRRLSFRLFSIAIFAATIGYALDHGNSYGDDTGASLTPVADRQGTTTNELDGADGGRWRLREGMKLVNQIGELREAGGRILFYPDGQTRSLQLLENLALERVLDDLDQSNHKWSVTGLVTEFQGGNYLLLHRAVLRAQVSSAPRPRP